MSLLTQTTLILRACERQGLNVPGGVPYLGEMLKSVFAYLRVPQCSSLELYVCDYLMACLYTRI